MECGARGWGVGLVTGCLVLGAGAASAGEREPATRIEGPGWALEIAAPPGFRVDQEAGRARGFEAFVVRERTPGSPAAIIAVGVSRREPLAPSTLRESILEDATLYRRADRRASWEDVPLPTRRGGLGASLRAYRVPAWGERHWVGYMESPGVVLRLFAAEADPGARGGDGLREPLARLLETCRLNELSGR